LPPARHRAFYNQQAFTLNVTRADMIVAGYSPSVRLFEAAACGTSIISDSWDGLATFFAAGEEIVIAHGASDVLAALQQMSAEERRRMGERGRQRALAEHTAAHRAAELEGYVVEALKGRRRRSSL
jgi:spore maturation protein CgeB